MANELMGNNSKLIETMRENEFYVEILEDEPSIEKYTRFPLSRVATLGTAFEPLVMGFQNVVNGSGSSGLYRVTVPKGLKLAEFKNGSGYLGSILKENGSVGGGQAVLKPLVCDPTMIFMAAVLANIDKKLDSIQELQQELLDFLVQKERSELKGDLNFLVDTLNNYKYNWNNEKYKNSNHIKVLDIKQTAERKIDFYIEQITSKIRKKSIINRDQDVKKQLSKLHLEFKDYQLSLYLYSFSTFLEVMLLENFDSEYLDNITNRIEDYSFRYRKLYTKCYDYIEKYANTTIESRVINGLEKGSKTLGDTLAKIPIISKTKIDETLIGTGDKLEEFGLKRIEETMKNFIDRQSSSVHPFIENIKVVNRLYNQNLEVIFDNENIYIDSGFDNI